MNVHVRDRLRPAHRLREVGPEESLVIGHVVALRRHSRREPQTAIGIDGEIAPRLPLVLDDPPVDLEGGPPEAAGVDLLDRRADLSPSDLEPSPSVAAQAPLGLVPDVVGVGHAAVEDQPRRSHRRHDGQPWSTSRAEVDRLARGDPQGVRVEPDRPDAQLRRDPDGSEVDETGAVGGGRIGRRGRDLLGSRLREGGDGCEECEQRRRDTSNPHTRWLGGVRGAPAAGRPERLRA